MLALAQALLTTPILAQAGGCTSDTASTPGTTIVTCSGVIDGTGVFFWQGSPNLQINSTATISTSGGNGLAGYSIGNNDVSIT